MTIDVFLPTIVRQSVAEQKSGGNVSGTHIQAKNDPSGEERYGEKGKPSPIAHNQTNQNANGQNVNGQNANGQHANQQHTQHTATPPFANYLQNQGNNQQPVSPIAGSDVPPAISSFLNDMAQKYGVTPPSPQQLNSALQSSQTYQPPVVVNTQKDANPQQASQQASAPPSAPRIVRNSSAAHRIITPSTVLQAQERNINAQINANPNRQKNLDRQKALDGQQTLDGQKTSSNFNKFSNDVQQQAYDYALMLEALNRYSTEFKGNNG